MTEKNNALSELAEELKNVACEYADDEPIVLKARRIIAELSMVEYYECLDGMIRADEEEINATFRKCLTIAEKGAEDEY